ncbi:MAG TPA: HD domain-containing protein [Verrucomicrobiae bacterium]
MYPPVRTDDPAAVEVEVQAAYLAMFPQADRLFVPRVFGWVIECFTGKYGNYQAIDARYHDFEHTLQGTLCLSRLLRSRSAAGAQPALTEEMFRLGLLAILLHDTGYLKTRDDVEGTGAKYTITHVGRSAEFAGRLLSEKGFGPAQIRSVQNMIGCTGVNATLGAIPFTSELERTVGCALATADLLGQMAADDYIEKLPILYAEFSEAVKFTGDTRHFVAGFTSPADLIAKTPTFWENLVRTKLESELDGLCHFLNNPYPSGPNWYLEKIAANMARLKAGALRT